MNMLNLKDGGSIPQIGFGTYLLKDDTTESRTVEIIRRAIASGYRYLDTAAFYENEEQVGEAVRTCGVPRKDLQVASKVWRTELGYEKTKAALEQSLERLDIGYLDLFLIHWPTEVPGDQDWKQKVQGSWKAMEEAAHAGKVRHLGLSNFLPHHILAIEEIAEIPPVLDQLELHAGHMQYAALDYCRKHDIVVQAWRPRGQPILASYPVFQVLAEKYHVTVNAVLLRFLLQQGIAILPRASGEAHMRENLSLPDFTLMEADMEFLRSLPPMGWSGQHPDFDRIVPVR